MERLAGWQKTDDLASVREGTALATLPDDEAAGWVALWREVQALRESAAR